MKLNSKFLIESERGAFHIVFALIVIAVLLVFFFLNYLLPTEPSTPADVPKKQIQQKDQKE